MRYSTMRRGLLTLPVVVMLGVIGLAMADKQTPAVSAGVLQQTPTPAGMPPSMHDSLYVAINIGFQALKPAFEHGCYDCHSKFTQFPWYYKLPIIKGLIDSDIRKARRQVDFSDGFPFAGKGSQADMLKGMLDEIQSGDMPPFTFRMVHWGRQIQDTSKESVVRWIFSSLALLARVGMLPSEDKTSEEE
jgi:hypothetical protein